MATLSVSAPVQKSTNGRASRSVPAYLKTAFGWADRLAPSLGARVAGGFFLTPPRFARPVEEVAALATAEVFAVPVNLPSGQVPLAAWRWDDDDLGLRHRPIALLVHGWGGRGSQLHPYVGPLRALGFQVVTFDMPAHGDTPGRHSSLPEFAWSVAAMVGHLGAPALVVTHSLGGGAVLLAATAPWIPLQARLGLARARTAFIAPPYDPDTFTERFRQHLGIGTRTIAEFQGQFSAQMGLAWDDVAFPSAAARYHAPSLVAHDRDDSDVPLDAGLLFARNIGAAVHLTSGLGHRRILRDPDVLARVLAFATA